MKYILFTCFVMVMCSLLWVWQIEGNTQNIALERAKNAVNRAAHGASLQTNTAELSEGRLVFNQSRAVEVFEDLLAKNMQLDSSLEAIPNTLFRGEVEIVYEDYVDDSNVVSRFGSGFNAGGKLYERQTPEYHLQKLIRGPSVIYVIKVKKPIQANSSEDTHYYIGVVYEYPFAK